MRRVILLLFLVEVFTDQPPISPCPNVFTYETDSERLKGLITIRTPFKYPNVQLTLWLKLSFTEQLDRKRLGSIFIKGRRLAVYSEGVQVPNGKGGFLEYYVHFAPEIPVPTLMSLMVDGQELCDPQEDPPNWRHRVTLEYYFTGTNGTVKESRIIRSEVREIEDFKDCGIRLPLPMDDGNVDDKRFDWPWHVAIFKKDEYGFDYLCGGTLVARRHVVTAAHCMNSQIPSSLSIVLGKTNIGTVHEEGQQGAEVKKIVIHPDFVADAYLNDIALIELEKPVHVSNYVRPACLWDTSLGQDVEGRVGWVPGWRNNETGYLSKELEAVGMPIVSQEDCLRSDSFYLHVTNRRTFCAGFRNGTGLCTGDSGGGLVMNVVGSQPGQSTWFLRGVAITGKMNKDFKCDLHSYAVFSDIAMFDDWLKTHILSM